MSKTVYSPCLNGQHHRCPRKVDDTTCSCNRCRSHGIAEDGQFLGQPSIREKLAEMLDRLPTDQDIRRFRLMRSRLGADPTRAEFDSYPGGCQ